MPRPQFSRRTLLLGTAAWSAAPVLATAADDADQRYAVLSIVGDKITLVGFRFATGSRIDQNVHRVIPISAALLDNRALLAVDDAVKRVKPSATTTLLASRDPALFALQDRPLDQPGDAAESVGAIKTLLQQSKATRLILVAPLRSEARFRLGDGWIGSGQLTGLGFYVDGATRIKLIDSGASGTGYLAPYAYLSVSLVDVDTMATIRRSIITESTLIPTSASKEAALPWDALSNDQKMELLQSLISRGIARGVRELFAGV